MTYWLHGHDLEIRWRPAVNGLLHWFMCVCVLSYSKTPSPESRVNESLEVRVRSQEGGGKCVTWAHLKAAFSCPSFGVFALVSLIVKIKILCIFIYCQEDNFFPLILKRHSFFNAIKYFLELFLVLLHISLQIMWSWWHLLLSLSQCSFLLSFYQIHHQTMYLYTYSRKWLHQWVIGPSWLFRLELG